MTGTSDDRSTPDGVRRRSLLAAAAAAPAAAALGPLVLPAPVAAEDAAAGGKSTTVPLRQGTDMAVRVSPDGRTLALDLVGVLWTLPAAGGTARRLTSDLFDIAQPDFAPDGGTIAFQSYRDGVFNLWTVPAGGGTPRQLTHGPYDHREPRWSPDGKRIAFSGDKGGSYGVHLYDVASGAETTVADTTAEEYEPCWSPDGGRIAFVADNTRIDVVDLSTGARTTAVTVPDGQVLHSPAFTPDGRELVYNLTANGASTLQRSGKPLVTGEEVFPFRVSWLAGGAFLYTADGLIRHRPPAGGAASTIPFTAAVTTLTPRYRRRSPSTSEDDGRDRPVRGIGSPVLSPDGGRVAFRALNDIYLLPVGGKATPLLRDHWWKSHPAFSPDGRFLSYTSDRSGKLDIWLRDLTAGTDRHLVNLPGAAALSGSWSHDGRFLAFLDQTGALHTVQVATGDVRNVYPATFEPGRPTWSPDGSTIALAAIKPYSKRYREGLSEILLVNRETGAARYVEPLPNRSIQTRGDDGPVWSPDGKSLAFAVASQLWVLPVRPDGTPTGPARRVTDEVTDAPSWSGDSQHLLYLNNGRLRLVPAAGGAATTVSTGLSWTTARPRGRTVIHAGRMWDGASQQLRRDVDVIVDGPRITAVRPHAEGTDGTRVDGADGVLIPGLVDMHNHREMQGYAYGGRQNALWLAMGITTTRSPGDPAYHMVEERESVRSGARLGPRYFGTGEAIDGPRIFYNFMRPTFDADQLARELERAGALGYDLMKAYVRLPTEWQQAVIDWAHRNGIPATSHYHYPATAFGGDGMEHIGATNRFGYSRTTTALGTGYSDVAGIFGASGAARTPTLFDSSSLFREDTSLVTDDRVRTLYPSWEYQSLQTAVTTAQTTDQTVTRQHLSHWVAQVVDMLKAGGRIVTGTDSPIDHTAVSTHMNLRALVRYGLTPFQALESATRVPGEVLGEPLGRIAPGMLADLVLLGGDPLTDITQAANVRQVMVNGVAHSVADLLAPYRSGSATGAANRVLPPVPAHPSTAAFWWHDPDYLAESRRSCCAHG